MILDKARQTILEHRLIEKNDKVILGLSGGHDSTALLDVLSKLKKELGFELILVHVNYGFRGKDSDRDEEFVRKLAKKYKEKIYVKKLENKSYKLKPVNLEDYFRQIRYDFFEEIIKLEKAQKIAVAHHLNDQIETILMFFLRGSGPTGLAGMEYKRDRIIRPFLDITREEISQYLKENKLKWHLDITNEDTAYRRNKIRHKLIPFLEKEFNPNLKNTLKMTAQIMRENNEAMNNIFNKIYYKIVSDMQLSAGKVQLFINLKKFLDLDTAFKRMVIFRIWSDFGQNRKKLSFVFIEEILKMIKEGKPGAIKNLGNLQIIKKYDKIIIIRYK